MNSGQLVPESRGGQAGNCPDLHQNKVRLHDISLQECYSGLVKPITYCIYREDEFFVAQCLHVDVSSFGSSREEAIANLKEAVELYFEGEPR
jgi:predicted RNase H-like HicB family nuclease